MAFFVFFAEAAGLRNQINEGIPLTTFAQDSRAGRRTSPAIQRRREMARKKRKRRNLLFSVCAAVLLAFITASGGTAQSAVYSPSTLFIQNFITSFICKITFPCVTTMLALSIISNINKEIKIKGFIEFLSGFMKWVTGLVGAVFTVFTAVKGFSAGVVDGIGIRTLKYAVGSSIPLVGGILSGGADVILSAFILTKNAFGIFMLILIFGAVISPIVETAALTLSLRLLGAITQPITDERTYFFIKSCVSALNHALAGLVLVAVMYAVNVLVMIAASGVV